MHLVIEMQTVQKNLSDENTYHKLHVNVITDIRNH